MNSLISESPIRSDAEQNLRMSLNLYQSGVISNNNPYTQNLTPSNYREPIPIIVNALFMMVHPNIDKNTDIESLAQGSNTKNVKQVNLIWIGLLLLGIYLLCKQLSSSRWLSFACLVLVYTYFIRFGNHFDSLRTELPAAVIIILSTLLLLISYKTRSVKWFGFTGVVSGILILTKGVFFYLFILLLPILFIIILKDRSYNKIFAFCFGIVLIVAPWIVRNYMIYNEFSITQRGGAVLDLRASYNKMSIQEIPGAIYIWGPESYRNFMNLVSLGPAKSDLKEGGLYQRFLSGLEQDSVAIDMGQPDMAISYFAQSRAEINRLQRELGKNGKEASRFDVYKVMESESKAEILAQPVKHTFLSVLFFWRGMWCFPSTTIPFLSDTMKELINNLVNLFAVSSLIGLMIYGFMKKHYEWVLLTILSVELMLIHAVATQYLPRMSEPIIPSLLIALCFALEIILNRFELSKWLGSTGKIKF